MLQQFLRKVKPNFKIFNAMMPQKCCEIRSLCRKKLRVNLQDKLQSETLSVRPGRIVS